MRFQNDEHAMFNGHKVRILYVATRDADGVPTRYMVRECERKKRKTRRMIEVAADQLVKCDD